LIAFAAEFHYYAARVVIYLYFMMASRKFASLMKSWQIIHSSDKSFNRVKQLVLIIHLCFMLRTLTTNYVYYYDFVMANKRCWASHDSKTWHQYLAKFILKSFFKIYPYSTLWGITLLLFRFYLNFVWTITGDFVIFFAVLIAFEIRQFNKILSNEKLSIQSLEQMWNYHKFLGKVVTELNGFLGLGIAMLLTSNLYNLCMKTLLFLR